MGRWGLAELPLALLGRLWPAERVLLGLRVCNFLKLNLVSSVGAVQLRANVKSCQVWDETVILNALNVFHQCSARIDLQCCDLNDAQARLKLVGALKEAGEFGAAASYENIKLSRCHLGTLPPADVAWILKGCCNLKFLDLSVNQFRIPENIHVILALQQCTSLQHLNFSKNQLPIAAQLKQGLSACKKLQHLDLSDCNIRQDTIEGLAEAIRSHPALTHLNLSSNFFSSAGATALAHVLHTCAKLSHLDLGCNRIPARGITHIAETLPSALTHLDFSMNNFGGAGAQPLAAALPSCTNLQHLFLGSNDLKDDGMIQLARGLEASTTLQTLDLDSNDIGPRGGAVLGRLLGRGSSVKQLSCYSNKMGRNGAHSLSAAMLEGRGSKLTRLNLGATDLDDAALSLLAPALALCHALSEVRLHFNAITDQGARCLTSVLELFRVLAWLDLSHNKIGNEGATALSNALRGDKNNRPITLSTLSLDGNLIGVRGLEALFDAVGESPSLHRLDVAENQFETAQGASDSDSALEVVAQLKLCAAVDPRYRHVRITPWTAVEHST